MKGNPHAKRDLLNEILKARKLHHQERNGVKHVAMPHLSDTEVFKMLDHLRAPLIVLEWGNAQARPHQSDLWQADCNQSPSHERRARPLALPLRMRERTHRRHGLAQKREYDELRILFQAGERPSAEARLFAERTAHTPLQHMAIDKKTDQ
jgi:hypothetical protein